MEVFNLILLLLACIIASSVLNQMTSRMSLPLIQIAVGLALAIAIPRLSDVYIDSEFFLMLFIAPLLFRESREVSKKLLWDNKWDILSLAICLVIVSVLLGGLTLNWIIPTIPLAAAFACAGALGPTDAAAVAALGSTIKLSDRQSILLSGEALINDASGVVSFQFAISAAVVGTFSAAEAIGSFAILFFGGIAIGIIMGFIAKKCMKYLRRKGYVSTTVHVIYEVLSPFLFFLIAEEIHVSGILAVVAAGLMMQEKVGRMSTPEEVRQKMVSDSFWDVIVFVINGILFLMLGMQLPKVMQPEAMEGVSPGVIFGAVFALTFVILGVRFVWISGMNLLNKDEKPLRTAIVTTVAGPKGAVTLSIIMTLPLTMNDGSPFPQRDLIIFVTSATILLTLLVADFLLPRLAAKEQEEDQQTAIDNAKIKIMEGVLQDTDRFLDEFPDSELTPAVRVEKARFRVKLMMLRMETGEHKDELRQMTREVLDVQRAETEKAKNDPDIPKEEKLPYDEIMNGISSTVGFVTGERRARSRLKKERNKTISRFSYLRKQNPDKEIAVKAFYDTCMFGIDLEKAALDYLENVTGEEDPVRKEIAQILIRDHETALRTLNERARIAKGIMENPDDLDSSAMEDFINMEEYADEAYANMLNSELDQIRKLRVQGEITETMARELREEVYLMQSTLVKD